MGEEVGGGGEGGRAEALYDYGSLFRRFCVLEKMEGSIFLRFPRREREDYIEDRFRGITLGRGSCIMTNGRGSDGVGVGGVALSGVALLVGGVEVALRGVGVQRGILEMSSSVNKIQFVPPLPSCKKYKGLLISVSIENRHTPIGPT